MSAVNQGKGPIELACNHQSPPGKKAIRRIRSSFQNWLWFLLILFVLWQLLASILHNPLICPSPCAVLEQMVLQIQDPRFLAAIFNTIGRALCALLFGFAIGIPCAFLSAFYVWCREFLNRLVSVLQTVPNVCYIILLLFWTTRTWTVILSGFFLLFPLIYRSLYEQLDDLCHQWREVWILYPQPKWVLTSRICFPMLRPALAAALKSASSLSFKACVTSEILTGLAPGIGKRIQIARLDLNLAGVCAWSLWLILFVFIFEKLWDWLALRLFGQD